MSHLGTTETEGNVGPENQRDAAAETEGTVRPENQRDAAAPKATSGVFLGFTLFGPTNLQINGPQMWSVSHTHQKHLENMSKH